MVFLINHLNFANENKKSIIEKVLDDDFKILDAVLVKDVSVLMVDD